MAKKVIDRVISQTRSWPGYFAILLGLLIAFSVLRAGLFWDIPTEKHVWIEVTLLLLIAVIAERFVSQLKQPLVMVLLIFGVLISPHTLAVAWPPVANFLAPMVNPYGFHPSPENVPNLVTDNELVQTFAQLGAIILLLRIGLHSKIELVFNWKNLAIALGGVIIPFAVGFYFASATGGNFQFSLFLGAALTATSVGITVAVLEEMKVLSKPFAQAVLGAAVIDDILALMVLGLVRDVPAELTAEALLPFAEVIAIALAFVISGIALGKLFINRFFSYEEAEISKRTLAGLLAIAFFYAFAAESLGMSAIVGAFIAGIVIAYSPMGERVNHALFPFDVVFTPIFFISLGLLVDVFSIPAILFPLLAISALAILSKIIGCGIPARLFGFSWKESLTIGWGMVPRGEIALIIALIGISGENPVLDASSYTLIASMAFITTVVVPGGLQFLLAGKKANA